MSRVHSPKLNAVQSVSCVLLMACVMATALFAQPPGDAPRGGDRRGPRGEGGGPGGPGGGFGGGRGGRGFGGGFGGGGMFGGGGGSNLFLVGRDNVREELKITPEQQSKIDELMTQLRPDPEEMRTRFQALEGLSEEDRAKEMDKFRVEGEQRTKDVEAKLKTVLNTEQSARLEQLGLHQNGLSALRRTDVADSLKLTDAQKKQVEEIQTKYEEKMRGGPGGGGFFGMSREDREKLRVDRDAELDKVLTAEQKVAWIAKLGPAPVVVAEDEGGDRGRRRERTGAPQNFVRTPTREEAVPMDAEVVADLSVKPTSPVPGAPVTVTTPATTEEVPANEPPEAETSSAGSVTTASPAGEKLMSFNFRYAPWEIVLKHFSQHAGLTLDLTVVPPGTFNYFDDGQFTVTQALDIMNGYLLQKGYLLIRRDRFLVVLNIDNGIPPNLVPQISLEELAQRGRNELVSVLIPLDGMDAASAADQAVELLGPQGKAVSLDKANKLLVTDLVSNVQRIRDLLSDVTAQDANAPAFKSFPLKNISVTEAEKAVRDLFGLPQRGAVAVTTAPVNPFQNFQRPDFGGGRFGRGGEGGFGRGDRGGDNRGGPPQMAAPPQTAQPVNPNANTRIQVAIDLRTNALLVTAKPADIKIVEQVIMSLDQGDGANSAARNQTGDNSPQLEVYPINTADPVVVIQTIASMVPSAIVNHDTKAKRLHIYAGRDDQVQIKALISQIDGAVDGGETSLVVRLRRLDPLAAAGSLRSLFKGNAAGDIPMIEADTIGRRIMVRGTTAQVAEIRSLLKQLGEDPDGTGVDPSLRGPVRTVPIGMRDAEEIANLLRQIWPEEDSNPIRVVVPSSSSSRTFRPAAPREESRLKPVDQAAPKLTNNKLPVDPASNRVDKSAPATANEEDPWAALRDALLLDLKEADQKQPATAVKTTAKPADQADEAVDGGADDLDQEEDLEEDPAAPATPATPAKPAASEEAKSPITITPSGGNLVISSEDIPALDRLQQMIEALAAAGPKRTSWTVFYLRSADATETATILGSLFPSGSVSQSADSSSMFGSLTSGISSMGSSLMDMTGLSNLGAATTLRIVPELRSNALFVSGPPDLVKQVEEVLELLDASELPESLRDRVPRMIAVEHAQASEVHSILQEIYKDYLQPQGGGLPGAGGGGMNPLAMLMAASGGQNDKGKGRGIRLTLGVDQRTNSIVVSADESLFRQVEELIHEIDASAMELNPTVRVVPVAAAQSQFITQALSSMVGRVRVSTTGSSSVRDAIAPPGIPGFNPAAMPQIPEAGNTGGGGGQRGGRGGGAGGGGNNFEQQMRQRFLQGAGLVPPGGGGQRGGRGGAGGGGRNR